MFTYLSPSCEIFLRFCLNSCLNFAWNSQIPSLKQTRSEPFAPSRKISEAEHMNLNYCLVFMFKVSDYLQFGWTGLDSKIFKENRPISMKGIID